MRYAIIGIIAVIVVALSVYAFYPNLFGKSLENSKKIQINLNANNTDNLENFPTIEPDEQGQQISNENMSKAALLIHDEINKQRVNAGVKALQWDSKIAAVALAHSIDMATRNYYSHYTPEGLSHQGRGEKAGHVCIANENLMRISNYNSMQSDEDLAKSTVKSWMNSPDHKRTLLTKEFTKEGIGVSINHSRDIVYVTENFC